MRKLMGPVLSMAVLLAFATGNWAAADIGARASVRDDGTLKINGKIVRLHGIYVPTFDYTCRTSIRPRRCAPRAVLQLDFKIQGFVYCENVQRFSDGTVSAVCRTGRDREDLAAWLVSRGWAVALPGAPFEYVTLERFAKANGRRI